MQLTPQFFFSLNEIFLSSFLLARKNFGHSVYPYFFRIFQSFKFWRSLRPLPSSVENGSECYCYVIEGARPSRATRTSLEIMPDACVVFGCSRTANPQRGIGLHRIPVFDDSREESVKRGRKWVNFVQQRRAK